MALVASTLVDLVKNLRAFAGILVVSKWNLEMEYHIELFFLGHLEKFGKESSCILISF